MQQIAKYISIILLLTTTIMLLPLQMKIIGWTFYLVSLISLLFCAKQFRKDMFLIFISLALLGITPITTDLSYAHFFQMSITLPLAIAIPYVVSRFVYKDYQIRFQFHHGRSWYKSEILYIGITALIVYFSLPFILRTSGIYTNWSVEPGASNLIRLFIGTNALAIWDELFFISTVLGLLRRHLSFTLANLTQGILFSSFLFELGFRSWVFVFIFLFALIQGYIFKKTESLFYVITIHLTFDLILYLALIHAHHPTWLPIFIFQ